MKSKEAHMTISARPHAWALGGIAASLFCFAVGGVSPVAAQEGAGASVLTTATATVQSIDLGTRMVTLKEIDGRILTIHVGPQVVNLPQVKSGDRVNVSRYEAVAIDFTKAAASSVPMVTQTTEAARAEPGELPAGEASVVTKITAQVVGINAAEHKVMFIGPAGVVRTAFVKRQQVQQLLNQLQVGDMVEISFAESEAVEVTPAT
jgi:Cu/Ag efflux protein CusF